MLSVIIYSTPHPPHIPAPQAVRSDLPVTALASVPCGVCPVIHECVDGGPISPETCIYYQHWLDF